MSPSRFTFFLCISILLFANFLCLPWTATAQFNQPQLISLPIEEFVSNAFIVYGRSPTAADAGLTKDVHYRQPRETLPDLNAFFEFGGTLELLTTTLFLSKQDIVISEIMWGLDTGNPVGANYTYTQWIELYNPHGDAHITVPLFLLFTPFENYPDRDIIELPNGVPARVLDAVSNLHLGRWDLPGKSGRRPRTTVVSAYRDIVYPEGGTGQSDVPFGSYEKSWKATSAQGRRNTLLSITDDRDRVVELPYIATPGTAHVPDTLLLPLSKTVVRSDRVVINEIRNDVSNDNLDWVELKNVGRQPVDLENWVLSIVTGVGADTDLVNLPRYTLDPGEILLLQRHHPKFTDLADGINISNPDEPKNRGAMHKYFVDSGLDLPNVGKFVLLLRSESGKNGQDTAIEDYAGNGFFTDTSPAFNTEFWPRQGQQRPIDVASFGNYSSFGALDRAWSRLRYQRDDGHHKDAWQVVGTQGGIGYAPGADRSVSPGTPGYENTAFKTQVEDNKSSTPSTDAEFDSGEISISEVMSDAGSRGNQVQWIELYNNSLTQAVNLEGWELEIRNLQDDAVSYVNARLILKEAIILPNQTLLFTSKYAVNNVIENRVYDLYQLHRRELQLSNRRSLLLNPAGFYLKLTDRRGSNRYSDDVIVDEAGNLKIERGIATKQWDLPVPDPSVRQSLVRQYQEGRSGTRNLARVGTLQEAWRPAYKAYISFTYYGNGSDRGTPGDRSGSPLPVVLSSFHPERAETGEVLITWSTESEVNNAGFNLLRSETRQGEFQVINPTLITGAGTTSERHSYDFTDTTAKPNVVYYYRIEDVSLDGVRRTLVTTRLKGEMSANSKLTTTWGHLKTQN